MSLSAVCVFFLCFLSVFSFVFSFCVLFLCSLSVSVPVFLPHIGGSFLHGASFYDHKKIIVGLTVRGKDADRFWFSLFHELGHILPGHLTEPAAVTDDNEKDADTFARDALISYRSFEDFTKAVNFSKNSIVDFAHSVGIDEGIVVGRLQKEGYIKYSRYNDLKTHYALSQ